MNTNLQCSDDVSCVQGKAAGKVDSAGHLSCGSRLGYAAWRSVLLLTADYGLSVFTAAIEFNKHK